MIGALVPASAHGTELVIVSVIYLVLAALAVIRLRRRVPRLFRDGLRTPYARLVDTS